MAGLFLYGTLCHAPLREKVLGLGHMVSEARLPGFRVRWAAGADYPVIVQEEGEAVGLLVEGLDDEALARADWFEAGFGYRLREVSVHVEGRGAVPARLYLPETAPEAGPPWRLDDWVRAHADLWLEAIDEALAVYEAERPARAAGRAGSLGGRWEMMKQRAASRLRARAAPGGHRRRADFTAGRDVRVLVERHPYTQYFGLADHDLTFRRFDGEMSAPVRRAGFLGGDAATVLPWDADLDAVLVVEQFRAGPFLRGDPRPWTLEPIAGRLDPGETPEACVRREALEEAGLQLGTLHPVARFYPSPGAVTEFVWAFVAEARLSGRGGEIGGVEAEHEDIRTHLVPVEEMMELIASGEAATAPLILSMQWLALNRARLRAG
ncbi:MAG: NUDIX domain-containing protein [Alphaproteobacteria bacterium]|nr:MAG: NUDIX domain-containing protein [Alphaproteobacteria bacterium]